MITHQRNATHYDVTCLYVPIVMSCLLFLSAFQGFRKFRVHERDRPFSRTSCTSFQSACISYRLRLDRLYRHPQDRRCWNGRISCSVYWPNRKAAFSRTGTVIACLRSQQSHPSWTNLLGHLVAKSRKRITNMLKQIANTSILYACFCKSIYVRS